MSKSPIKVKVAIEEDLTYAIAGLGKRYKISVVFIKRGSDRTVKMGNYGSGYTFKEACEAKRRILNDYRDFPKLP